MELNTDLYVLLALGLLAFVLQLLPGTARFAAPGGLAWGVGNREDAPPLAPWAARLQRAHANLMENLPHYGIVVLVAQLTDQADATTAMASVAYLVARVAHAVVYGLGITYVRTVAFYAGVFAELAIVAQILS